MESSGVFPQRTEDPGRGSIHGSLFSKQFLSCLLAYRRQLEILSNDFLPRSNGVRPPAPMSLHSRKGNVDPPLLFETPASLTTSFACRRRPQLNTDQR